MGNNLQKILAGSLATLSSLSVVTPVMAATVDVDALYKNAYDAMVKAQETEKQTDINAAMDLIRQLRAVGVEKNDSHLINEANTWSSLVDKVQHPKLVKIVDAIVKAQDTGRQADINAAFATIEPELPGSWKNSYTSALDLVQQKLQRELVYAVETAENDRTKESVDEARVLVDEVLTAENEAMVKWATIFKDKINNIILKDENIDDGFLIEGEVQDGTASDDCFVDEEVSDLNITDIDVNRKQIIITFDSLAASLDDVTLTVLDNNGDEVEVKSVTTIKKGSTKATFEFVNYLPVAPTGVWNVNGVSFNLTEKAFVEEVKNAKDATELKTVLTKKAYKDLVTYNEGRLDKYVTELKKAESLKEVKDIQDIIDAVNAKLDGEQEIITNKSQYLELIKKAAKNGTQGQFDNLLNKGVELGYIKNVNSEYMEEYKGRIKHKVENNWIGTLDNIQKCIDEINQEKLQEAINNVKSALVRNDKKAVLTALQNSALGLKNINSNNIDAYMLDAAHITSVMANTSDSSKTVEELQKAINVLNAKVNVVNATTLPDMLEALTTFAQVRDISEFNVLLTENKQDAAQELLKVSYNGKLTLTGKRLAEVDNEVKNAVSRVRTNLKDLKLALEAYKKESTIVRAGGNDASNKLCDVLNEITGQDVSAGDATKFYEASINDKGELKTYTSYTQVRAALK